MVGAFAPLYGLDVEIALRLASPLGGGMARQGHICGAVSGALLVLGLARGAADASDKDRTYALAGEFLRSFEAEHGSVICRQLIGMDISTPEGLAAARESGVTRTICPALVRGAVTILQSLLA